MLRGEHSGARGDLNELDRRIATEVMGELEPRGMPSGPGITLPSNVAVTESGNWRWTLPSGWQPLPFSANLEYATKAVDKYTKERGELLACMYDSEEGVWHTQMDDNALDEAVAPTLPEAICNLLLALKEKP